MSRWMMPFAWATASVSATRVTICTLSPIVRPVRARRLPSVSPAIHSIARKAFSVRLAVRDVPDDPGMAQLLEDTRLAIEALPVLAFVRP